MSDKIDYVSQKIDGIAEKVSDIDTKLEVHIAKFDAHVEGEEEHLRALKANTNTLEKNTSSLQEHMRRTELLEVHFDDMKARFTPIELESIRKKAVADYVKNKLVLLAKVGAAITGASIILTLLKHLLSLG